MTANYSLIILIYFIVSNSLLFRGLPYTVKILQLYQLCYEISNIKNSAKGIFLTENLNQQLIDFFWAMIKLIKISWIKQSLSSSHKSDWQMIPLKLPSEHRASFYEISVVSSFMCVIQLKKLAGTWGNFCYPLTYHQIGIEPWRLFHFRIVATMFEECFILRTMRKDINIKRG